MDEIEMVRHLIGIADKSSSLTRVEFVAVREAREYVAEGEKGGPKKPARKKPARKKDVEAEDEK